MSESSILIDPQLVIAAAAKRLTELDLWLAQSSEKRLPGYEPTNKQELTQVHNVKRMAHFAAGLVANLSIGHNERRTFNLSYNDFMLLKEYFNV